MARAAGVARIDFRAVSAAIKREGFAGWVSLEAGPARRADGPDHAGLHRILRTLATYDWDFRPAQQTASPL
jgi:sugar phosphate isomerase/epimerase